MDLSSLLIENIVFWAENGYDQYGQPKFSAPASLKGRHEAKNILFTDATGKEAVSRSVFYFTDPDGLNISVDGFLLRGSSTSTSPHTVNAEQIRSVLRSPSISNDQILYKVLT